MATAAQIREHYDSLAFIYRTYWGEHIHHGLFVDGDESPEIAQIKMLDHCVQLLDVKSVKDMLDVGCGNGGTLLHMARLFGCQGTGVTISPKQARIAKENAVKAGLGGRLNFVVEDVNAFLFPVSAFDLAWAMESSEHFLDKALFLRNVTFALRPGGRFLLAAWTGSMELHRVREVARAFLCPELWTPDQYRTAAETAGLQVIQSEDLTAQVIRTWEICRQHARLAAPVVKLLPQAAQEFVEGIDIILDAYRSGDLTYTVLVAQK